MKVSLIYSNLMVVLECGEHQIQSSVSKPFKVKHGSGGVLIWEYMVSPGVGKLVFIDDIMDKIVYLNILKENLKESAAKLGLRQNFYFQSDNCPYSSYMSCLQYCTYFTYFILTSITRSQSY